MAVPALWVVEHFDVIKDVLAGLLAGCVNLSLDALTFEQLEEILGYSVVLPVVADELTALV